MHSSTSTRTKKSIHHYRGTPKVTEQTKLWCIPFFWDKRKRVYTMGPESRVYTIEHQTRKKKKRRVSWWCILFLPCPLHLSCLFGEMLEKLHMKCQTGAYKLCISRKSVASFGGHPCSAGLVTSHHGAFFANKPPAVLKIISLHSWVA